MRPGSFVMRTLLAGVVLSLLLTLTFGSTSSWAVDSSEATTKAPSSWRGPAALWLAPESSLLFAACEKSGSMIVMDVATGEMVTEKKFGKSLVAMAATTDGRILAVC